MGKMGKMGKRGEKRGKGKGKGKREGEGEGDGDGKEPGGGRREEDLCCLTDYLRYHYISALGICYTCTYYLC